MRDSDPHDEAEWLEWKTHVDPTDRKWRGEIALNILGFANRSVEGAARFAEGYGYLLSRG